MGVGRKEDSAILQRTKKMSGKQKILFASEYAGLIGGTERFIYSAARLLSESGFECEMLYKTKADSFKSFSSVFARCIEFGKGALPSPSEYAISTAHRIVDSDFLGFVLTKYNATLFVHDHTYFCPKEYKYFPFKRINCRRKYGRFFCGLCLLAQPPRKFGDGFLNAVAKGFRAMPRLYRAAVENGKFAVLSDFMADELVKNGVKRGTIRKVSPYLRFTALRGENAANGAPLKILFAGQHVASKGLGLLVESLSKMRCDFRAEVLGTGMRTEYFKSLARKFGVADKMNFSGFSETPELFYDKADVVVFPSLWQEPFGLVGIEAMARGKPVVGFNVGGVGEWLKDGHNGILVGERDTAAFASALDRLSENRRLLAVLGANARRFAEDNYSEQNFLKTFLDL